MAALSRRIRIPLSCRTYILPPSLFSCIHSSPFSSHTIITPSPSPPTPQTPSPPISLFLLTECHFSPSQISKIMQTSKCLLKTRSPHTARAAVEFLKQRGFTQPQLHTTILRHPTVLALKVDTQLKPKFHYIHSLGFTDQELRNLITTYPRVLGLNLGSNRISFLENLFGTKSNLTKALKRSPELLVNSVEKTMKPKLDLFKQWGIQGELLSLLLSTNPNVLVRFSIESLAVKMDYATNTMGIVQGSKTFVNAIRALLSNGHQNVEKKMKHLRCLGFLEHEVRELLKKNPGLLIYSTNKMQENMDFLTQTAGLKLNVVFSNPSLLQLSVKKRLMPRNAIFQALSSEKQSTLSLQTIFKLSERMFLEKVVECNPKASILKEIYKGKMESVGV